jgi:hypothetical protein
VSRSSDSCTKSLEFGDDRIGGSGPHEQLAVLVVVGDEAIDFRGQILDRSERPATDRLVGDDREESLDLVEPGRIGRSKVQVQARTREQTRLDLRMLVAGIVFDGAMHFEFSRNGLVDSAQELEELLVPIARLAQREDRAVKHIQCSKQRRGAVTHIIVRGALDVTKPHR